MVGAWGQAVGRGALSLCPSTPDGDPVMSQINEGRPAPYPVRKASYFLPWCPHPCPRAEVMGPTWALME